MKGSMSVITVLAALVFALLAGVIMLPTESVAQQEQRAGFRTEIVADNLDLPWDLEFFPNGDALVTERDTSKLLRIKPSGKTRTIRKLPANGESEGGLLGVALSPRFKEDRLIFAYYSTQKDNRVVRFRIGQKQEPILTGIPVKPYHNGGRIDFGPGGLLYVATGDAGNRKAAQNKRSLAGKILRIRRNGGVPKRNPFGNPVWSLGHRNVQGLSWDGRGRMYASELGNDRYDEVNRISRGRNYGWPKVEGRGGAPRYRDPLTVFNPDNASPSGTVIQVGSRREAAVKSWNADLFMASLKGERLWRMERDKNGRITDRHQLLKGRFGRLRHVAQAPDGSLWLLTSNGNNLDKIVRLSSK